MAKCKLCPRKKICRDTCYGENPCDFALAFERLGRKLDLKETCIESLKTERNDARKATQNSEIKMELPDGTILHAVAEGGTYPGIRIWMESGRYSHGQETLCFAEYNPEHPNGHRLCVAAYSAAEDEPVYYEDYAPKHSYEEVEAPDMAIAAPYAQQEAEKNEPLTLEELRQMDGQPVYITKNGHPGIWALVFCYRGTQDVIYLIYPNGTCLAEFILNDGAKIYRRPPVKEAPDRK